MCDKCVSCKEPSEFIDSETDLCLECLAEFLNQEDCIEVNTSAFFHEFNSRFGPYQFVDISF